MSLVALLVLLGMARVSMPIFSSECTTELVLFEEDCTTQMDCFLDDNLLPEPQPNRRSEFRTCITQDEECIATEVEGAQNVEICREGLMCPYMETTYPDENGLSSSTTLQRIISPNFGGSRIYISSSISRYNIDCKAGMFLQYSFDTHHLEIEREQCDNGAPNACVDFVRLRFPTYQAEQISCGTLDNLDQLIAMDGLTSLNVEFVTNRVTEEPGVNLHVYCRDPAFDVHFNGPLERRRRNVEDCTSPNGDGPRDEPFDPPPARRIQKVLDRDPSAVPFMLEVGENLTYIDNTVILSNGTTFMNINNLTVENRIQTKTISRSSTGSYGGFAQIVVSGDEVVMVQFGVRPIFMPTEEEATFIALLESGIIRELGFDNEPFLSADDELNILPRNNLPSPKSKRGVDSSFLNDIAMEFGNACNGILRGTACHYQDIVLGRDCMESEP
jgi:hypothetical protein